jgi:hypothetical protein
MVGKADKWRGATSGLYGECSNGVTLTQFLQAEHRIQFRFRPMRFIGFSNHEKEAPRQEISKWAAGCTTFSTSGWSFVRSASLAKTDTSKQRPSPHLHNVPTLSNESTNFANGPGTYICVYIYITSFVLYECVSKSLRTEAIKKYMLTTINTCWEATQRVMEAKRVGLTYKIEKQLHLVAESCTICSSRSRWPVRELLDTLSYV